MTLYETIGLSIAVVALVISTVSLIRIRKFQTRQLDFEAITAALAKKQLELIKKDEQTRGQACVTAELVKMDRADYRFVIMNQGNSAASEVVFEIDAASPDNPLVGKECQRKLPYPLLQSGQSFTLIAALHMGSAMSYQTHLRWKNSDGSQGINDTYLST